MGDNKSVFGILAQFSNPGDLMHSAEKVRDAGYKKFDCHSPFPIHGMDKAMGMKRSPLGFIVFFIGLLGAISGLALQGWASAIEYPMVIAGKPYFSWQAFIIIIFGFMVIFGAFASVLGMLKLNGLPRLFHPLFYSNNFQKVTDDGFFISIEASDPQFDLKKTAEFLTSIGGNNLEVIPGEK